MGTRGSQVSSSLLIQLRVGVRVRFCSPTFSPPLPMLLAHLPDVLVQSVFHNLQSPERLLLSQCSSRLLSLAASSFAWQHAPPISVTLSASSPIPSHRFLGVIPLALTIPAKSGYDCTGAILSLCMSPCRVVELSVLDRHTLSPSQWGEVFACPSVYRHLEYLQFPSTEKETVQLACESLPRLHTLICAGEQSAATFAKLSACPALTCLSIEDSLFKPADSCLAPVLVLTTLRRLHIRCLSAYESFLPFCAAPGIHDLEELHLAWFFPEGDADFNVAAVPEEVIAAGFAAFTRLHTLSLSDCGCVDLLLEHLHRIPTLRRLSVHVDHDHIPAAQVPLLRDALLPLIQSLPQLCCQFVHRNKDASYMSRFLGDAIAELRSQLNQAEQPLRLSEHEVDSHGRVHPPLWPSVFGSGILS